MLMSTLGVDAVAIEHSVAVQTHYSYVGNREGDLEEFLADIDQRG